MLKTCSVMLIGLSFVLPASCGLAGEGGRATCSTIPERALPAPAKRGQVYPAPRMHPWEPRADHHFEPTGDGRIEMRGGYTYSNNTAYFSKQYVHVGGEQWVYDVEAGTWTGPAGAAAFPADTRTYRRGPYLPEHYTAGERPNAAAVQARLKDLPANTWVAMNRDPAESRVLFVETPYKSPFSGVIHALDLETGQSLSG